MKHTFLKMLKILFYPLIWCRRVIMEAPIIDVDNALIGTSDWMRYSEAQEKPAHVRTGARTAVIHR